MTPITFKLYRFNVRRLQRKAPAAEVDVFEDGVHVDHLWMTPRDVAKNIKLHGHVSGLAEVQEAYRLKKDVPERAT